MWVWCNCNRGSCRVTMQRRATSNRLVCLVPPPFCFRAAVDIPTLIATPLLYVTSLSPIADTIGCHISITCRSPLAEEREAAWRARTTPPCRLFASFTTRYRADIYAACHAPASRCASCYADICHDAWKFAARRGCAAVQAGNNGEVQRGSVLPEQRQF